MDLRHNDLEVETVPIRGYKCFEFKDPKTFGSYIRKLRVLKGLVQKELGERLNTDVSTIVAWENNHRVPCKDKLKKLISVLEADPLVLVQYEGVLNERHKKILKFIQHNPMSTQRACREAIGIPWNVYTDFHFLKDIGVLEREVKERTAYYWVRT